MSNFSKKFVSVALTLAMAGMLVGSVPAAKAQSTTDLQAQISALLAQIAQLQAQLNGGSTGSTSGTCASFTRNLTVGSTGSDVKDLQVFLNKNGYVVASSGAGSMGSESTYFGSLTAKALAKWQAAVGISPAVGYFGPITRAKVNSMCTSTGGGSTGGGSTGGNPVPGAGVSARLSVMNPSAGSLISSSASAASRVPVLAVDLTAGTASGITVSDLSFQKNGVLSDSSISGAYLVENGKVLSQYNSITSGKIVFSGLGLNIAAGQTRTLWLAIDPASGLTAGNTVSFSLASASDVKAWDSNNAAAVVSGSFPSAGNIFQVTSVSNPSLATLSISSTSIATQVNAGTNNVVVGAWTFNVGNSKVWLDSINLKVIGSANKGDLRNVKLFVNGAQVGSTLSAVAADGATYFQLPAKSVPLGTGNNSIQVFSDIAGSPNMTYRFAILNSYDVYAVDSQYNVPVTAQSNNGTEVTISSGAITLQSASDTPTGNISANQNNVTLAKFTLYAAGESVKVKWLGWGLNITGATTSIDNLFRNVSLVDDAGGQLGSTKNTLSQATTDTCTDTVAVNSTSSYRNCFGNSSSPINYIVPANTTRTLYLKADVVNTASFATVVGLITANTSNLQGLTSSQTASTGAANGAALTFSANALTVSKSSSLGTTTLTPNSAARKIGSYTFSASSAEGVNVSTITILTGAAGAQFQNLVVKVNGAQFGDTKPTLSNSASYVFSGSPFAISAGTSVTVDVYADVLSSATTGTKATITTISGCTATGASSGSSITCSSTAGQSVVIGGQATLTVTAPSGQPSEQIVMGSTGTTLAQFTLQETSNVEDIRVTDLNVFQATNVTSTNNISFSDLVLYNGSTAVGSLQGSYTAVVSTTNSGAGFYWKFRFGNGLVVPQSGAVTLTLKGNVNSYSSSNALDNATHVFKISTSTESDNDTLAETVVALGATSNASSAVTLSSPTGATKTVLRTKLTFSPQSVGTSLARSAGQQLAKLNFTADAAGSASINSVTVTFSGNAASIATFLDGVTLVDSDNPSTALGTGNVSSSACTGSNTCSKSFILGAGVAGLDVSAGQTKTLILIYDGTKLQAPTANVAMNLSATINAQGDVVWTDNAVDSTASTGLTLPSNFYVPAALGTHTGSIGG